MNISLYKEFEEIAIEKNITKARELQISIAKKVMITGLSKSPEFVAGADACFQDGRVFAAASLYEYPRMVHIEDSFFAGEASFPYIPGLFAFREGPALISAIQKLRTSPDAILIDGQGIAHPRGAGIATHLGIVLNIPTIGCAKSRLVGDYDQPGMNKGEWTYIFPPEDDRKKIGAALRTRSGVKPLFVSPGHLIDIETSVEIVLNCTSLFRIPEPIRSADMLSRRMKVRVIKRSREI